MRTLSVTQSVRMLVYVKQGGQDGEEAIQVVTQDRWVKAQDSEDWHRENDTGQVGESTGQ